MVFDPIPSVLSSVIASPAIRTKPFFDTCIIRWIALTTIYSGASFFLVAPICFFFHHDTLSFDITDFYEDIKIIFVRIKPVKQTDVFVKSLHNLD
ncbi:MAG: hypothetical protein MI799_00225 [Desulfobacterales bacterium]|nr:hypothetical protein [Desulfobacterales bacterium]